MGDFYNRGGGSLILTDLEVDGTTVVVDETNDRVGIGTAAPGTQLQVESNAPYVTLKNDTAENTAAGCESKIIFEDHGNNALGQLEVSHVGTADDEKGQLILSTNNDSGLQTALTISEAQLATFAGSVAVTVDLAVDGVANLDNTDIDGTFTMDGATFDVNATGAVTVDGTTLSLDGTDSTNLTMTANSSSAKALTIDAVNSGSGVASITLGTTSGTAVSIGHTTSETTVNDNLTVTGDLTVNGTTTTINSTTLTVDDLLIEVASGAADSNAANGAGISIDGADATITYAHTGTKFVMNKPLDVTGAITATSDMSIAASKAYKVGSTAILSDSSGTMTLSNIDALDATTEATIETAIDTLSNLTTVGTIATGVWNGTAVASAYLDADTAHLSGTQTFTGTKTLNSFKGTGGATVTNILDEDAMGSNSATALATQQSIKAYADTKSVLAGSSSITTVGTVGTGTWQGTAVASAYLDAQTAHLDTVQTFTGAKTFSADVVISGTTPKLTIGDAGEEDTMIVFDGHAQDFRIGLDDGTDSLEIGVGAANGTTPALIISSSTDIEIFGSLSINSAIADEKVSGTTAVFDAGEAVVRGDCVYYKAGDSKMHKVNMTAGNSEAKPVVAMAAEDISINDPGKFLLQGFIHDAGTFDTFVAGDRLYAPKAEGGPTKTAPAADGDLLQVIGWAVTADKIYFNPSPDYIEIA